LTVTHKYLQGIILNNLLQLRINKIRLFIFNLIIKKWIVCYEKREAFYKYSEANTHNMAVGTIYLIINKINGHKYVGQTTRGMNKRWAQHIQEANRMSQYPLHKAMRKHGNHNFMVKELEECDTKLLNEREEYYIEKFNTFNSSAGYNATSGGEGGLLSDETKQKISDKKSEMVYTDEHCDNISKGLKDKLDNNEKWGFHLPENRGEGGKHLRSKIMSINVETGEERVWDSASEAAIELTGNRKKCGNIIRAMDNGWKAYGYLWKRLEPSKRYVKVYGVHKKTWIKTQVFDSIKEAGRIFGSEGGVRKSLNNPRKNSYKGYYWFKA